ncbi:hypothetical protein K431DRAFT_4621 [Polychaeton citri CBS 116435]|uniref:DNA replication checkpoint mediator MRC1 domain-containing protein n=1 Tax=Polychaeton citri CBS 116435 TaxID=1314669 RepID=A0A9P4QI81_9PEZI|nr:hypothetical protein K431DRAFT_4621 [Polychaeton citri CBS 116435]
MSSPVQEGDVFLSPRSRVAKMLADIDNGIESGLIPLQDSPLAASKNQNMQSTSRQTLSPATQNPPLNLLVKDDSVPECTENGEDGDDIVRPVGRATKRMLKTPLSTMPTPSRKHPDALASSSKSYKLVHSNRSRLFDNEEDDLYSATPAASRHRSPIGSARSGNGLFVSPAKHNEEDLDSQESDHDLPLDSFRGTNRLVQLVAEKRAERLAREAELKKRRQLQREAHRHSTEPLSAPFHDIENTQHEPDRDIERIMSDASRPTRKASKKALLEMERETQRMARQQALAHRMEVKKKFTTHDLFAKFNYKQTNIDGLPTTAEVVASSAQNSDGTQLHSDGSISTSVRRSHIHSTPPSSPPSPLEREREKVEQGALSKLMPIREDTIGSLIEEQSDEELPHFQDALEARPVELKSDMTGSRIETDQIMPISGPQPEFSKITRWGKKLLAVLPQEDNSDDDLEVEKPLPRHLKAFQKARSAGTGKTADSNALHHLRYLSSIGADSHHTVRNKSKVQSTITATALEAKLRKRALLQARRAQEERLAELRAKGISIQTAEERDREAEDFENLLEKARQDAVELRKAEKVARQEANAQLDEPDSKIASSDESEDGDCGDSGSEEEGHDIIDEEAEETSDDEKEVREEDREEPEAGIEDMQMSPEFEYASDPPTHSSAHSPISRSKKRTTRRNLVITDDEEVSDTEQSNVTMPEVASVASQNEDPFAAFNFGSGNAGNLMSPTQAFNATMQTPTQLIQEDSMVIFGRYAPAPSISSLLPTFSAPLASHANSVPHEDVVPGSQLPQSQRVDLALAAPETPAPATVRRDVSTLSALDTPGWEPSQDRGLPSPWVGTRRQGDLDFTKDVDHETQSTVHLRISESPAPSISELQHAQPRRGRLTKRQRVISEAFESDDEVDGISAAALARKQDAFATMAMKRREALTAAERAEAATKMREMMDEQAEESEDEYAGLGGDDFIAPETAEDHEMIDSSQVDVDEHALAAHHADRERIRMEQETNKLFKDLTSGALRRRGVAGGDWELEEAEDEVASRRRQIRLREEARKRKLLLQDESLAGLAHGKPNKGKDAFLKAIADDDDGDSDSGELSDNGAKQDASEDDSQPSQHPTQQLHPLPLTETTGNAAKHSRADHEKDSVSYERPEDRLPARQRRTNPENIAGLSKRPTTILEVRESLSFLLDEPLGPTELAGPTALDLNDVSSDDEYDGPLSQQEMEEEATAEIALEEARVNDGGFAALNPPSSKLHMLPPPRPTAAERRTKPSPVIIDRLSLRRNASSSSNSIGSDGAARSAWATTSTNASRIPSLLRRATTSSAVTNDRGVTTSNSFSVRSGSANPAATAGGKVIKTTSGGGKSSFAAQARAEEKKAIVEASARRRVENTRRIAEMRRAATVGSDSSSGLARGLGGGGGFE